MAKHFAHKIDSQGVFIEDVIWEDEAQPLSYDIDGNEVPAREPIAPPPDLVFVRPPLGINWPVWTVRGWRPATVVEHTKELDKRRPSIGAVPKNRLALPIPTYTTANRPSHAVGGLIFDTTLGKLVIGGATAWEVVTSV